MLNRLNGQPRDVGMPFTQRAIFFGVERCDQDPARDIAQATIRDATIETKGRVRRKEVGVRGDGVDVTRDRKKREVARRVTVPHYPFAGRKKKRERERDEMF